MRHFPFLKRKHALSQQEMLEKKVEERTAELNQSLQTPKATQTQLIHSGVGSTFIISPAGIKRLAKSS